ncbi:MAG: ribose 5-phosphate isomerase B [Spirochaetaceae bacterium]|nr:ribose 5-phosphate isomerase B [Spirochaetaceae bacterium]
MNKKIILGTDHGGFKLKERIKAYLEKNGHIITDAGVYNEDSVDYPDIASKVCNEYKSGNFDFGILFCGTALGISMAANKIKGIRCAVVHDLFTAEMCKAHNNANFLAFGGRIEYNASVEKMIDKFIETTYEGGRHEQRINKISALEK